MLALERREQPLLGLRPDPGNALEPAGLSCVAKLVDRADAERRPDLDHPLWSHAQETAEADELGLHVAFELVQLGDPSSLDELAETRGDPWTDPAEVLHAT